MATSGPNGIAAIRTLALVGPAGAGKTTLAEALLHAAGAVVAPGSVERGTTVSDHDPLERRFRHSLVASAMHATHAGTVLHLLDTPGLPELIGQALPALEAVETAAVVVGATAGIEPMAVRMMEHAARRGLDRIVIVNRIDEGADLEALLGRIRDAFGRECLPLNLPADGATRVLDCFFAREGRTDFSSVADAHRALVEQVVEVAPDFVERYLNDGDVDPSELHEPLEQALREGHLIPVCFVSARTGAGVRELLDVIERLLPNPAEGNPPPFERLEGETARPVRSAADPDAHVLAHVIRVANDPYLGRVGVVRVRQGTLRRDAELYVEDRRRPFRIAHLYRLQGREHVEVQRALPGELCAVPRLEEARHGAVLHDSPDDDRIRLRPPAFPVPMHGLAIEARRRGDEQRLWDALARLADEDPCLRLERAHGGETVVYGLGDLHLRVLIDRLRDAHKLEVDTRPPRIAYRETVGGIAEGRHRHKKQTGGAGQFGEVLLRVEPLPRGAGFEFVDHVKGGAIPTPLIPAVEKGVRQAMEAGVASGHPMVDLRVVVLDGKHHPVDSKEVAFVAAGRRAFEAAVRAAGPVVLEPIVEIEVEAPAHAMGDVTGDLASRRGHVVGTDATADGRVVVRGLAPLAELSGYGQRLNAMTAGQGRWATTLAHHAPVPGTVQQQLVAQHRAPEEG